MRDMPLCKRLTISSLLNFQDGMRRKRIAITVACISSEKICDGGLYLTKLNNADEAAKKNYVLHILDNEGVKHPKFKYTGVKFARSVMPANLKEMGKKIVENMMLTQDRQSTDIMINQALQGLL